MSRRPALLAGRRWVALGVLVVLALGQAAAMVVTAFATRDVFAALRDGGAAPTAALAAIAAAGLALCALRAMEGRVGERAGQSYAAEIRRVLFLQVTRMPAGAVARRRRGALALRYVGDLAAFKGWIAKGLARAISAAATIPTALLVLYLLHPMLFAAALGPVAAVTVGMVAMARPLGRAIADLRSKRAGLAAAMAERLPQGIALRRSGRLRTELKALDRRSGRVADAGVRREWLASGVRALPDAGAGLAAALCLWTCLRLGLGVPEAVAATTALAMVVWPLRHLADVIDRRRAFLVASAKLDRLLAQPRLPAAARAVDAPDAPAVEVTGAAMPGGARFDLTLAPGEVRRLEGPSGSGKTALLQALAGLDAPPEAVAFAVLGGPPGAAAVGRVLFLGGLSPRLRGSLRREATIGLGRRPEDDEVVEALTRAGLADAFERLGGLEGTVAEGRRNLTATEAARLHLARALLARPDLVLVDADEVGLGACAMAALLGRLAEIGAAALVVTSEPEARLRLGPPVHLGSELELFGSSAEARATPQA